MQFKKIWHQSQLWLLTGWCIAALLIKPGWLGFAAGCLVWAVVLFLTAPGVFWYWSYFFNFNPFKTDANLRKAIACRPLLAQPYLTAGVMFAKERKWDDAIAALEQAILLASPKNKTQIKLVLAAAYRETGALDKAAALLEELEAAGQKNYHFYTNYAAVHLKRGHYEEACAAAAKARSFNVNATEPVLITAKAHFGTGEFQAAKDDYDWVIPRLAYPVEAFYWLGRTELELQMFPAAVEHLKKAVERIGDDPELSDVPLEEARLWLTKAESQLPVIHDP